MVRASVLSVMSVTPPTPLHSHHYQCLIRDIPPWLLLRLLRVSVGTVAVTQTGSEHNRHNVGQGRAEGGQM